MSNVRIRHLGALFLAALMASSCSNPETEKVRHLERGDQYAAEKRDEFAVVEYASAVKIDPKFGEARLKLARNLRAAEQPEGRVPRVHPRRRCAAGRSRRTNQGDADVAAGRAFRGCQGTRGGAAREEPEGCRGPAPAHANAMAALRDPAGAIAQIEEALKVNPDSSPAFLNLGAVRMQSGEAKEAEAAFRKAIELEPSSVNAKLALANFLWAAERAPEAEATTQGGPREGTAAPAGQPHAGRALPRHPARQRSGAAPQGRGRRFEGACGAFSAGRLLRERRPHRRTPRAC